MTRGHECVSEGHIPMIQVTAKELAVHDKIRVVYKFFGSLTSEQTELRRIRDDVLMLYPSRASSSDCLPVIKVSLFPDHDNLQFKCLGYFSSGPAIQNPSDKFERAARLYATFATYSRFNSFRRSYNPENGELSIIDRLYQGILPGGEMIYGLVFQPDPEAQEFTGNIAFLVAPKKS